MTKISLTKLNEAFVQPIRLAYQQPTNNYFLSK
jgi:hypothetical protein